MGESGVGGGDDEGNIDTIAREAGIPLGSIYAVAAVVSIVMGYIWYENGIKGIAKGKAFLGLR